MPTRLGTLFPAVAVLLLSGCGLNHVPPRAQPPFVTSQEFVLWQTDLGQAAHVVGFGEVGGTVTYQKGPCAGQAFTGQLPD